MGKSVAMIEENPLMYGGTCINIACIPTKTMIIAASKGLSYDQVLNQREVVTSRDVYTGHGEFISNKEIAITAGEDKIILSGETIIINTGAVAIKPNIDGIDTAIGFYNSTEIQQLSPQPSTLGVIGAGPIGLEFDAKLGTKVTVFNIESGILKREEPIVQELANEYLTEQGITILNDVTLNSVSNDGNKPVITANGQNYTFDAVLYATGRKPNTANIGLENTDITTNERGAIVVNDTCESSVPSVYAVGDVNGGPQFTYISLDDFRIVFGALILGATLYSQGAEELINLIKMAMDNNIPYTYFKNQIFTHPTMAENLNDLCNF